MKALHTPGPWRHTEGKVVSSPTHLIICDYRSHPAMNDDTAEANARLIDAAPELLEALQDLFNTYGDDTDPRWIAAQEALAKATEGKTT